MRNQSHKLCAKRKKGNDSQGSFSSKFRPSFRLINQLPFKDIQLVRNLARPPSPSPRRLTIEQKSISADSRAMEFEQRCALERLVPWSSASGMPKPPRRAGSSGVKIAIISGGWGRCWLEFACLSLMQETSIEDQANFILKPAFFFESIREVGG